MSIHIKKRIAYISWVTPHASSGGGPAAMYRHFVMRHDFDLLLLSSGILSPEIPLKYHIPKSHFVSRMSNTRLARVMRQYQIVLAPYLWTKTVKPMIEAFNPDIVFTVADPADSWGAYLLSQRMGIPFVVNFQDWWPESNYHYDFEKPVPFVRRIMARRFRIMHRDADLVFCTSQGMLDFLGPRQNAHVLLPTGPPRNQRYKPTFKKSTPANCLRLGYAGQLPINSYGKYVLDLAHEIEILSGEFELFAFGSCAGAAKVTAEQLSRLGMYKGFLSPCELEKQLQECDVLLAVMGFSENSPVWLKTSFTTKILDYARLGKPILIWGPDDCSPVKLARKTGFALTCTENSPRKVLQLLSTLKCPTTYAAAAQHAWEAGISYLDHDLIHKIFVNNITKVSRSDQL